MRRGRGNFVRWHKYLLSLAAGLRPIPLLRPRRPPRLAGDNAPGEFPIGQPGMEEGGGPRSRGMVALRPARRGTVEGEGQRRVVPGAQRAVNGGRRARGHNGTGTASVSWNVTEA